MGTILLVEADPNARALMHAQLIEAGQNVFISDAMDDALSDLALLHPNVLVLDSIGLPLDYVHQVAIARRDALLLLCTGVFDRQRLDLAVLKPARILTRPFSIGDLVKAVEALISTKTQEG